ncbi:MAG: hypothetical protein AAFZ01_14610 [Pseudomonadota bacterium]
MTDHETDRTILVLLQSIRFRLNGGTVWLKIAEGVIERDEGRQDAIDAMLAQRRTLEWELSKLNAAITLCEMQCPPSDHGGASCR